MGLATTGVESLAGLATGFKGVCGFAGMIILTGSSDFSTTCWRETSSMTELGRTAELLVLWLSVGGIYQSGASVLGSGYGGSIEAGIDFGRLSSSKLSEAYTSSLYVY